MLSIEDFIEHSDSFELKLQIWKKDSDLFIYFKEDNKEDTLKEYLPNIQEEITWVEENKSKFEEILLEENVLELIEDIAGSTNILDCTEEESYLIEDDTDLDDCLPMTEDELYNSLFIETMAITFDKEDKTTFEIFLDCDHDYLEDYHFLLNIDEDKNIIFKGLEED